jgi:hypothetical protein
MTTRFRVATTLAGKLEELGVSPADVLRQARLPTGLFDQEKILVSTKELFALYRGLAEASRDPAIGLKLGTETRIERYDPIAIAAVSARSFRDALQRLARYKQLACPRRATRGGARRRRHGAVQMAPRAGDRAAAAGGRVLRPSGGHCPPRDGCGRHPEAA